MCKNSIYIQYKSLILHTIRKSKNESIGNIKHNILNFYVFRIYFIISLWYIKKEILAYFSGHYLFLDRILYISRLFVSNLLNFCVFRIYFIISLWYIKKEILAYFSGHYLFLDRIHYYKYIRPSILDFKYWLNL